jgi:hypothetical protein
MFRLSIPENQADEAKALIYDNGIGFDSMYSAIGTYFDDFDNRVVIQFRSAENMGKLIDKLEIRNMDYDVDI